MSIPKTKGRKVSREMGSRYFAVSPVVDGKIYKVTGYHNQSELVEAPCPLTACLKAKGKPRFTEAYLKALDCFQENLFDFAFMLQLGENQYHYAINRIETQATELLD